MQVRSEVRCQGPGAGAGGHTGRETHHVGGRRRQGGHCGEEAMSAVEGPPRAPPPRCRPLGGQPSSRPTPHCPARLRDPWSLPGVTSTPRASSRSEDSGGGGVARPGQRRLAAQGANPVRPISHATCVPANTASFKWACPACPGDFGNTVRTPGPAGHVALGQPPGASSPRFPHLSLRARASLTSKGA